MVDLDSLLLGDDRSFVIGLGPQSLPDGSSGKKMPPIFLIFFFSYFLEIAIIRVNFSFR